MGQVCLAIDPYTGDCTEYESSRSGGVGPLQTVFPASQSSVPTWLQNILGNAFGTAEKVLVAKTQTKGILTQTAPGQFTYVQPEGSQVTLPVNVSPAGQIGVNAAASPGMGLVLVGGVALVVLLMMMKRS
jgi:hypothetical protein